MTSNPPRETHPTQRELLQARSDAISKFKFPNIDDALGWKRERALLRIVEGLNKYIAKGSIK